MCCRNNNLSEHPVNTKRLTAVMDRLTNHTVLGELLAPVADALTRVRNADANASVLPMFDFIGLGVLRHLQGMHTLREQVQSLLHLAPAQAPESRRTNAGQKRRVPGRGRSRGSGACIWR